MNRNYLFAVPVALMLFGAACEKKSADTNADDNEYAPVVINMSDEGQENANSNAHATVNTNTSEPEDHLVSGTLLVSNPEPGDELESPFTVEGKSAVATVYVSVKSISGATFFTIPVTVRSGAFKANVTFDFSNTTSGSVIVFEKDAGGNMTNAVTIAATFKIEASADTNTGVSTNENANDSDNENINTGY